MKKLIALLSAAVMAAGLLAGCSGEAAGTGGAASGDQEVYVLVPSADHGWTGAALENAKQKAGEITAGGVYKVTVQAATEAKNQQEQLDDLLSRGKVPAGIVVLPYDNTMESSMLKLAGSGIPFVMYDRIIANPAVQEAAAAIVKGDHTGIGSNTAQRFMEGGLPGYGGPSFNPFATPADELSLKMVLGLTKQHVWSGENGNHIKLVL